MIKRQYVQEHSKVEGELCEHDKDDMEDLYRYDDQAQAYVFKKMLLMPKVVKDSQQNKLSQNGYTINNNIFDLITDNGSCETISSNHIVDKLKLPLYPQCCKVTQF